MTLAILASHHLRSHKSWRRGTKGTVNAGLCRGSLRRRRRSSLRHQTKMCSVCPPRQKQNPRFPGDNDDLRDGFGFALTGRAVLQLAGSVKLRGLEGSKARKWQSRAKGKLTLS